jgi:hypothetical protein
MPLGAEARSAASGVDIVAAIFDRRLSGQRDQLPRESDVSNHSITRK